ncbi:MAG: serine--tRNA ligase [Deltaproteobacteria bacterium]|jgi:seryl-tRNA synthetase|nr:serine--tRNA ligase [Deltaproteobacteria bacterium]
MLDLKLLQKQPELVAKALKDRHSDVRLEDFQALDSERRLLLGKVEALKGERNRVSAEIAALKRRGLESAELVDSGASLGERIKKLDEELALVQNSLRDWMLNLPNIPDAGVPPGRDERDNAELLRWGEPRRFAFAPKEHWEIGSALGGLDFERAGRLTGSRFAVSWGWAARLERALVNFFLDVQTQEHGYTEILPPQIVNRKTMLGTGQLPKFAGDLFKLENWDYFLIPTAEVPLTNLHAEEVLEEESLPLAYTAQTACFRSEAGSAGKDTRGLVRQHQFTKVEMVRFSRPDQSFAELELMREQAERLLRKLELPYRVVSLCAGDLGFSAAKTYDLEVWLPGQNRYREISSCSNCTDFQARRANIRFRPKNGGRPEFVHTLNGSGLPVGRTMVAIIENGQEEDGSFVIPPALRPYMNGLDRVKAGGKG